MRLSRGQREHANHSFLENWVSDAFLSRKKAERSVVGKVQVWLRALQISMEVDTSRGGSGRLGARRKAFLLVQ